MTSAYGEHGEGPALVVCTGSDSVRVGSGSELTFRRAYPCCTGVPKVQPLAPASRMLKPLGARGGASAAPLEALYAGGDVLSKAHLLDVTYPVRNGIVDNWVCAFVNFYVGLPAICATFTTKQTAPLSVLGFPSLPPHPCLSLNKCIPFPYSRLGFVLRPSPDATTMR